MKLSSDIVITTHAQQSCCRAPTLNTSSSRPTERPVIWQSLRRTSPAAALASWHGFKVVGLDLGNITRATDASVSAMDEAGHRFVKQSSLSGRHVPRRRSASSSIGCSSAPSNLSRKGSWAQNSVHDSHPLIGRQASVALLNHRGCMKPFGPKRKSERKR